MKKVLREQFAKRREEKERRGPQKESEKEDEQSEKEGSLSERHVSVLFMIEKGLYIYMGNMPEFLVAPIRALRWKRFFQEVIGIRPGIDNTISLERIMLLYYIMMENLVNMGKAFLMMPIDSLS
ncbi:hypothetical protein E5676_scaffold120G001640 [Cucumis melo var. makuwa]|uniref:Uncharacterized protein n=1 Tax=Cucumis melo var. makuwa TaxID=1194695 RepID=A0A5D3DZF0_CUCMM|nr:hypothetical protein E5676_scaffold120G001640 [Cucumis melo var. makuwa]